MSATIEYESWVSADRLFKAAVLDWHTLGPKVLPDIVAGAVPIQGAGEVGSIRQINFTPAMPVGFIKERLDFIDLDKLEAKSTLIEGGDLGTKLEAMTTHFKFVPLASGGCLVRVETTYKTLPGVDVADELAKAEEAVNGIFKAAEGYLQANPTAYV